MRIDVPITPSVAADAPALVLQDPLAAPGADGWAPQSLRVVSSRHDGGFLGSAVGFALGSVQEAPGQRLTTAQVDAIAPELAQYYGSDEQRVRDELAKVYLYVGGPATGNSAMTIGHHVFVPDAESLRQITSRNGRRWLTHELAHTMQFAVRTGSNPHAFLSSYIKGLAVGIDPTTPGASRGPLVWGALFTGLRARLAPEATFGGPATSLRDRGTLSLMPAATVGTVGALSAAGLLATSRALSTRMAGSVGMQPLNILGTTRSLPLAAAVVGAPLIAGGLAGMAGDSLGSAGAGAIGGAVGAAIAGTALVRGGAFAASASRGGTIAQRALAVGAVLGAGALGVIAGRLGSNTVSGWSRNAQLLEDVHDRKAHVDSLSGAIHDAHWLEADAELATRPSEPATTPQPVTDGMQPARAIDWALWNPLIVGMPLAAASAAAIGGTRLLVSGQSRGALSTLALGGATTIAPLVTGGTAATLADRLGVPSGVATGIGVGAGALTAATLATMLSGRTSTRLIARTPQALIAGIVGGGLALLASRAAIGAAHPAERKYDIQS